MYRETEVIKDVASGQPYESGDLVINIGPQHPATHGVLR